MVGTDILFHVPMLTILGMTFGCFVKAGEFLVAAMFVAIRQSKRINTLQS